MPKYEYEIINPFTRFVDLNKKGGEGWRIVPGIVFNSLVMIERELPEVDPNTSEPIEREEIKLCGAEKAGGWGVAHSRCMFKDGHLSRGIPHSWVTT